MIVIAAMVGPGIARAQHIDVLNEQINGQLVTGTGNFDTDTWTLGPRVFHRDFGTSFAINNPGFNSIGAGSPDLPSGSQALPAKHATVVGLSADDDRRRVKQPVLLEWTKIRDGVPGLTASDIKFGAPPLPSYTLTLYDISDVGHAADGTNTIVPGGVIDTTASDGFIHRHLYWFLQDNDGNGGTTPADGLYLVAIRMKMPGLSSSLPVFLIFGTPNSSVPAEDDVGLSLGPAAGESAGRLQRRRRRECGRLHRLAQTTLSESASSGLAGRRQRQWDCRPGRLRSVEDALRSDGPNHV